MTPLALSDIGCMLSVGAICRFCTSKIGGIVGGGQGWLPWLAVLVSTGWTISHLLKNHSPPLVLAPFLRL